ncbi:MAG: tRNA (adenosine(37)-N6)-threonylcarbamoyltransferase complex transferase subunit TsaD [Candidatus Omnitrophica bacterium]|nr:tRNA (adenosine(37)-N6)-threonylcarbamoyltransferase complex transferase subunit TsaD [Candidatus Omnitrophota bacterium]
MLILGIETSCDETSAAVVSNCSDILSNVISSSLHLHKRYGGVVPEIACRHHTELINIVLEKALKKAKVSLEDIDAVAVTQGPGLVGALLIGISLAKALSYSLKIPLIGINHLHAHLYSAMMGPEPPELPAVGLIVSGGHTSLVYLEKPETVQLLGQTRDDACGEAFDKVAKILDLGFPGGPIIEKKAKRGSSARIRFPRSYLEKDSLDFSFSGIKTAVLYHTQRLKAQKKRIPVSDICASFQEAVIDVLVDKTRTAIIKKRPRSLLIGGGVTANKTLRDRLLKMARSKKTDVFFPPTGMYMDNAAMVAGLGCLLFSNKAFSEYTMSAEPGLNFCNKQT